jgi:A/G-specific adenine glycosylase
MPTAITPPTPATRPPALRAVPPALREAILEWFERHGRSLAFRRTRDPYAILVSEAMAQQTQAARAAERWERFIARFPTVEALAAASPADVLREWRGLGYDRRGLNLWRTAREIVDRHGGRVPSDVRELEALPGVGPYTARAVAAIAYGMPVGAVDTNVRRVLGRIVAGDPALMTTAALQRIADEAVPPDRPGAWTHALMDVGATVCRPRNPTCDACPARPWCAFADGVVRAGPATPHPARPRATHRASTPRFPSTTRWLRGRIMDRLRDVPGDRWLVVTAPIGEHDEAAVSRALAGLAADGLVEVDGTAARLRVA